MNETRKEAMYAAGRKFLTEETASAKDLQLDYVGENAAQRLAQIHLTITSYPHQLTRETVSIGTELVPKNNT